MVAKATAYHKAGLPNITGRVYDKSGSNSPAWTIDPELTKASGAFMMAKHKLIEAIEKRNKESYHTEGDI